MQYNNIIAFKRLLAVQMCILWVVYQITQWFMAKGPATGSYLPLVDEVKSLLTGQGTLAVGNLYSQTVGYQSEVSCFHYPQDISALASRFIKQCINYCYCALGYADCVDISL